MPAVNVSVDRCVVFVFLPTPPEDRFEEALGNVARTCVGGGGLQ